MKLVTVANKENVGLSLWRETAKAVGFDAHVVGMHSTLPLGHATGKFGAKFLLLTEWLMQQDPRELILVTDGFDVMFVNDCEQQLLKKLETCELFFSGELYENPDKGRPYNRSHWFPYLNSGIYAGRAGNILRSFAHFFSRTKDQQLDTDDQRYFTQLYFANIPGLRIAIDHTAEVFTSLAGVPVQDATPNAFTRRVTMKNGNMPSVLHFQGYWRNILPYVSSLYCTRPDLISYGRAMHRMPGFYTPYVDAAIRLYRKTTWKHMFLFCMCVWCLYFVRSHVLFQ